MRNLILMQPDQILRIFYQQLNTLRSGKFHSAAGAFKAVISVNLEGPSADDANVFRKVHIAGNSIGLPMTQARTYGSSQVY